MTVAFGMGDRCYVHHLFMGDIPVGNTPDPSEVESWNQETGVWDSFEGKQRWIAWISLFEGRDRAEVLARVKEVLGDTDLSRVGIFVRAHSCMESGDLCSSAIGIIRCKNGFPEAADSPPSSTLEEAVFSNWGLGVKQEEEEART